MYTDAIGFVGATTRTVPGNDGSASLVRPPGTSAGDLLLATVASTNPTTAPSGWVSVALSETAGVRTQVWRRTATDGDQGSWSFSFPFGTFAAGSMTAYRGVRLADPIANWATRINGIGTSHLAPSTTQEAQGAWLVNVFGFPSTTGVGKSSGSTQRVTATAGSTTPVRLFLQDSTLFGAAGASTGTRTVTTSSTRSAAISLAIEAETINSGGSRTAATYQYTSDGRLLKETLPDGSRTYAYGTTGASRGRLTTYTQSLPYANRTTALSYDASGRISSETTAGLTTSYAYDDAGQLLAATRSDGSASSWMYDDLGRRTTDTVDGTTTTYRYDEAGQLCWAAIGTPEEDCSESPAGATTYTYDDAGRRLTERRSTTDRIEYTYGVSGRLGKIERIVPGASSQVWGLGYDPRGNVVSVYAQWELTLINWDIAREVPQPALLSSFYPQTRDTLLIRGVDRWATHVEDGVLAGIASDVRRNVTTAPGTPNLARSSSYDAWGDTSTSRPLQVTLGYGGELTLDSLTHLRARAYDASSGAFTTRDPLDGVAGTPVISNPYSYANNDPLGYVDPLGLQAVDADVKRRGCIDGNCHGGVHTDDIGGVDGFRVNGWHMMECLRKHETICGPGGAVDEGGMPESNAQKHAIRKITELNGWGWHCGADRLVNQCEEYWPHENVFWEARAPGSLLRADIVADRGGDGVEMYEVEIYQDLSAIAQLAGYVAQFEGAGVDARQGTQLFTSGWGVSYRFDDRVFLSWASGVFDGVIWYKELDRDQERNRRFLESVDEADHRTLAQALNFDSSRGELC